MPQRELTRFILNDTDYVLMSSGIVLIDSQAGYSKYARVHGDTDEEKCVAFANLMCDLGERIKRHAR